MAQTLTVYRSDAGNDFPTEFEAWQDDLRNYLASVVPNAPMVNAAVDRITSDIIARDGKILEIVQCLTRHAPASPMPRLQLEPVTETDEPPRVPPAEKVTS